MKTRTIVGIVAGVIVVGSAVTYGVIYVKNKRSADAGDENTGGDNTGGENTGGDNTGGENTGGENTGGENTGGENTGGETTTGGGTPITQSTSQILDDIKKTAIERKYSVAEATDGSEILEVKRYNSNTKKWEVKITFNSKADASHLTDVLNQVKVLPIIIDLKENDIFKTADGANFYKLMGGKKKMFAPSLNTYWQSIIPIIITKEQFDSLPTGEPMDEVYTIVELVNRLIPLRNIGTASQKQSIEAQLTALSKTEIKKYDYELLPTNTTPIKWYANKLPPPPPPLTASQIAEYAEINSMGGIIDGYLLGDNAFIVSMYKNYNIQEQAYDEMRDRLPVALDYLVSKGVEHQLSGSGGAMRTGNKDFAFDQAYANTLAGRIKAIALTQGGGMANEFNDYFGANFLSWDEIGQQALLNQIKKVYIYKLLKKFGYTYANGVATKSLSFSFSKQNNNFADNFRSL